MNDNIVHWTCYETNDKNERKCDEKMGAIIERIGKFEQVLTSEGWMSWKLKDVTCKKCKNRIEEEIDTVAIRSID